MEPGFVLNFHFSLYFVLIAIVGVFFVFLKELFGESEVFFYMIIIVFFKELFGKGKFSFT